MNNISGYSALKQSFRDGLLYRINPDAYLEQRAAEVVDIVSTGNANKVGNNLRFDAVIQKLKNPSLSLGMMGDMVGNGITPDMRIEYMKQGKTLLKDTFNRGTSRPKTCTKAWYDALFEMVAFTVNSDIGKKAPIQSIKDFYDKLSKSLSNDTDFNKAKADVLSSLKEKRPKTYKKILKNIEQMYNQKLKSVIDEAVKKLI